VDLIGAEAKPKLVERHPQLLLFGVEGSEFENHYFTEMCSGSEAGSYLRLVDCVHHSTLGLRVIKKKKVEG